MITKPLNIIDSFLAHTFEKICVARVHTAGKHEILPDKQAIAVAQIIKDIVFVKAPSPHPKHIHVSING